MIHGIWRSAMNVLGWAEGSLALLLMLSGCRRSAPLQEIWGEIQDIYKHPECCEQPKIKTSGRKPLSPLIYPSDCGCVP